MKPYKIVEEVIWTKKTVNSYGATIEWKLTRFTVIGGYSGKVLETTYMLEQYIGGSLMGSCKYKQEWRMIKRMKESNLIKDKEW